MNSARWFLKLAPDDAKPYINLTMIAVLPLFSPNSVTSVVCTFSEHGAVRYAFCISDVFISRSFNAAKVRVIPTDSLETTLAYINLLGTSTIWPPATRHAFLEKFSILIENIMSHFMYWEPTGGLLSSSRILNATFTALIFFVLPSTIVHSHFHCAKPRLSPQYWAP